MAQARTRRPEEIAQAANEAEASLDAALDALPKAAQR